MFSADWPVNMTAITTWKKNVNYTREVNKWPLLKNIHIPAHGQLIIPFLQPNASERQGTYTEDDIYRIRVNTHIKK